MVKKIKLTFDSKATTEGPLGFIIENKILKEFFFRQALKSKFITFFFDVNIKEIINKDYQTVKLKTDKGIFECDLLVGADGRYSKTRELSNLKYSFNDYNQKAMVFNISHKNKHNSLRCGIFFPSGPLALLPMKNKKMSSVVWTLKIMRKLISKKKRFFDRV